MSSVLLIDTNFSSGPIYKYLVSLHHKVYVVGGNPNDFLAKSLPNYINIDYTNLKELKKLIHSLGIEYIIPGCNDRSYEVCSDLNASSAFYGIDTAKATTTLNNKKKFREFAIKRGIPVPRLLDSSDFSNLLGQSVVIKPVDAFSGKGITVLHFPTYKKIERAIEHAKRASRTSTYIAEEFVDGQLYSHSAFISNGKVTVDFIVAEFSSVNPYVVDTSYLDNEFPQKILQQIREYIQRIVLALDLRDGLIHTQFIRRGQDFWLIEITRRCPGDLYSKLIEISTGYKYAENYTKQFLGKRDIDAHRAEKSVQLVIRHTITQEAQRIFLNIDFHQPASIIKFLPVAIAGDQLKPSPLGRVGILFAQAESVLQRDEMVRLILQRNFYSLEYLI